MALRLSDLLGTSAELCSGVSEHDRPFYREVARLSLEHDTYRWICGGVSVNYHAHRRRTGSACLRGTVNSNGCGIDVGARKILSL